MQDYRTNDSVAACFTCMLLLGGLDFEPFWGQGRDLHLCLLEIHMHIYRAKTMYINPNMISAIQRTMRDIPNMSSPPRIILVHHSLGLE
jgi:hypothetical protein